MQTTKADVTVREATMDDIKILITLCKEMVATSNFEHVGFDARHFGEYCMRLIVLPEGEIFLAVQDGEVIGALLGCTGPGITSPGPLAYDLGFYIRPGRRSLKAAHKLIDAYVNWAKSRGVLRVAMGNSAGAPDEGYCKLLSRSGFQKAGSLMYINL